MNELNGYRPAIIGRVFESRVVIDCERLWLLIRQCLGNIHYSLVLLYSENWGVK